ncbi:MAG: trypsin-like serine protease [Pseudomonadota bacterium]
MRTLRFRQALTAALTTAALGLTGPAAATTPDADWAFESTETGSSGVETRIVNGDRSADGQFPFIAALRSGMTGRLALPLNLTATGPLMSGSDLRNFEGETIECGRFADEDDRCEDGDARGKVCILEYDYPREGRTAETPGQQADRCAAVGGIAAVFVETASGSTGVYNVRDSESRLPAINGGRLSSSTFAQFIVAYAGEDIAFTPGLLDYVYCGGSYLGDRWVATAAHCVTDLLGNRLLLPSEMAVTVGVNDLSSDRSRSEAVAVEQIISNPGFRVDTSGTIRGDWALIRLSATPESGSAIPIASASNLNAAKAAAGAVTVIGWGGQVAYGPGTSQPTRPYNIMPSSTLRHAVIQLADTDACNAGFLNFNTVYEDGDRSRLTVVGDEEVCHANRQTFDVNVCHGDSGGPSVIAVEGELQLVGATSWGPGPGCAYGFDGSYAVSASLTHVAGELSRLTGLSLEDTNGLVIPSGTTRSGGGGSLSVPGLFFMLMIAGLRGRRRSH